MPGKPIERVINTEFRFSYNQIHKENTMNSYHFSLGNSSIGPIGFCARIEASTPEEAVKRLKELIFEQTADTVDVIDTENEYVQVYFNLRVITTEDITGE